MVFASCEVEIKVGADLGHGFVSAATPPPLPSSIEEEGSGIPSTPLGGRQNRQSREVVSLVSATDQAVARSLRARSASAVLPCALRAWTRPVRAQPSSR